MGWIGDVIPRTTIRSVWGNAVRNQLVQRFASPSDRDLATPRQPGMFAFVDSDHAFSYTETDNTWRPLANALPVIPQWRAGIYTATFDINFPTGGLQATIPFSSPMADTPVVAWVGFNSVVPNGYTASTSASGFVIRGDSPPLNIGHQRTIQYIAMLAR